MELNELRESLYKTGDKKDFIHLHLHSDFSLKDGIGKPNEYAKKALEIGMPALAITDHGSIGSHPSFFIFCRSINVKPIIGVEMYLQDRRSEVKELEEKKDKIDVKIKMLKQALKHRRPNKEFITKHIEYYRKMLELPTANLDDILALDYSEIKETINQALKTFQEYETELSTEREKLRRNQHVVLLAKNEVGRKNITKIVSDAARNGFYYKPRTSTEFLIENKEGIIVMSACLAGIINNVMMRHENLDEAKAAGLEVAKKYKEIFGDDFAIEIMVIDIDKQRVVNKLLLEIAKELNIRFVVTNDVHYLNLEGAKAQEISLMLGSKDEGGDQVTMKDKKRRLAIKEMLQVIGDDKSVSTVRRVYNDFISLERFIEYKPTNEKSKIEITLDNIIDIVTGKAKFKHVWEFSTKDFWFKDRHQMIDTYIDQGHHEYISPEDFVTALNNTLEIAKKVDTWDWDSKEKLPKIDTGDENISSFEYLTSMTREGWTRKAESHWYDENSSYLKRVKYELSVIRRTEMADYFIIVADYIKFAKNNGVTCGPARGSAAGSLVCFLLDITNVDPLKHELLFERFLSMSRSTAIFDFSIPDFSSESIKDIKIDDSNIDYNSWFQNRLVKMEE